MRTKGMTYEGSDTATHPSFCRKRPVVSQHAVVQGYASRVFPACLRNMSKVSSHRRLTEPLASGPSRFFYMLSRV